MSTASLLNPDDEGNDMYRDRLAQHQQSRAEFVDSTARAREDQRRQRASYLADVFSAHPESFDSEFLKYHGEDDAVFLLLQGPAAIRALELIRTGRVQ